MGKHDETERYNEIRYGTNAVISLTYVVNVGTFNEQKMVIYESSVYN